MKYVYPFAIRYAVTSQAFASFAFGGRNFWHTNCIGVEQRGQLPVRNVAKSVPRLSTRRQAMQTFLYPIAQTLFLEAVRRIRFTRRLTAAFSRSQPNDSELRRTSARFCCKALFAFFYSLLAMYIP